MKEKIEKEKIKFFFCICDRCGSLDWFEGENYFNSVEGGRLLKKNLDDYNIFGKDIFCAKCEKSLKKYYFSDVTKEELERVVKMPSNERREWSKNMKIIVSLDKEEDKTGDEDYYA